MGEIGNVSAAQNHAPAGGKVSDNSGDKTLYKEKLVFSASELGLNGKRPATIVLTERQVETKIFQKYGFNPNNRVQNELLKLRFDTKNSPFAEIDWGKGQFVAQLNSKGQYEITVGLREKTLEALSGRLINSPSPKTNNPTAADPNATTASRTGINAADYRRRQIENKLPPASPPSLEGLTAEQKELVADLTQVGLSVIGIFDPTGIADGADALISIKRGDYWGAGISALGIIPYLGDLAKIGKLPKLVKIIENVVSMAKADAKFAKAVEPLLKGLKNALDNLPINKLPNWAKEPIEKLSTKIDEFFAVAKIALPKVTFNQLQLQKKFKHAGDFGITGNFNSANALKFQQAIESHIASPTAKVIQGTYRGNPVTHIFDQKTGINVMVEKTGEFISGWKLSSGQAKNVLTRGSL